VRDKEIDEELVTLIKQHHVAVMPNIAISENAIHAEPPAWLDAPLLHETAPAAVIDRVRSAYARRPPEAVARARTTYAAMERSLARLNAAGVTIVLGTDDGAVRDHFYAFTAHRELQLLAHAGMTPARILDVATRATAEFLRLPDLGTLEAGKRADFIVLSANPLDDIANTRKIDAVYTRGEALDRPACAPRGNSRGRDTLPHAHSTRSNHPCRCAGRRHPGAHRRAAARRQQPLSRRDEPGRIAASDAARDAPVHAGRLHRVRDPAAGQRSVPDQVPARRK
jgi:hypothetical protein